MKYGEISPAERGNRNAGRRAGEIKFAGRVSTCLGRTGTAAGWGRLRPGLSESIARLPSSAALVHAFTRDTSLRRHPLPRAGRFSAAQADGKVTSLVRALALHGVAMLRSHLASPLRPGRGVLIRSVSRRLGSVACVREDASPNEVSNLTNPRMPGLLPGCQTEPRNFSDVPRSPPRHLISRPGRNKAGV